MLVDPDEKKVLIGNGALVAIREVEMYGSVVNHSVSPAVFSAEGKMLHEMEEQYQKQVMKVSDLEAHNTGIVIENLYNSSKRASVDLTTGINPGMGIPIASKSDQAAQSEYVQASDGKIVDVVTKFKITGDNIGNKTPSKLLSVQQSDAPHKNNNSTTKP